MEESIDRKTGTAVGFAVGIGLAVLIVAIAWLQQKVSDSQIKTQALPIGQEQGLAPAPAPAAPFFPVITPPAAASAPQESIVDRLAPTQEEIIGDIEKSFNQLVGGP